MALKDFVQMRTQNVVSLTHHILMCRLKNMSFLRLAATSLIKYLFMEYMFMEPEVMGRVGPDPQAELQVDPARGPQAQGLGRPSIF